jgi:hypothetical protein
MIWLGLLTLFLSQAVEPSPSPALPEADGVYYRQADSSWVILQPAVILDAKAKGIDMFVYTAGYTDMAMHIACRGPHAATRIPSGKPTFYARGIGSTKDAMLIRMAIAKDSRVLKTSFSNVAVDNKGGFDKHSIYKLGASENPDGFFSLTPDKTLPPGEYLLVFGNASAAYDFGIDKAK